MDKKAVIFYHVSGRGYCGWLTMEEKRCPNCDYRLGMETERAATKAEYHGIIAPFLEKNVGAQRVVVECNN